INLPGIQSMDCMGSNDLVSCRDIRNRESEICLNMRTRVPTLVGEVEWQSSNVARAAPSSGDGGTLPGTKPIVVARDFKGGKYEFYESRMVIRWIGRRNEIDYSEILDVDSYSGS